MACCRVSGTPAVWANKRELAHNKSVRKAKGSKRIGVVGDFSEGKAMERRLTTNTGKPR